MNVNVQPLVGAVCMTYEDGAKLHDAYRPAFDRGETVVLDFANTRIFVSRFFNAAVGLLLKRLRHRRCSSPTSNREPPTGRTRPVASFR